MGTLSIPNTFNAGTTIVAGDMNANFIAVKNYVEGDVLQESTATAKGDIYVASSSGVVTKIAVGTNDHVLTADSSQATGIKWAAAPADATKMPLAGGTFTGAVTYQGASPILLTGATTGNGYETTITVTDPTADRTLTLPNATGTVALTSDIPGNSVADSIISNQVFS